jgi:hypothetical protein
MSDSTTTPPPPSFEFHGIAIDSSKVKSPSLVMMAVPPEFFTTIGLVTTSWGQFETLFDSFLMALAKANALDDAWRNLNFRKRRKLFRDEMAKVFATAPDIISYIEAILDDTISIYVRRNLVVHGHLTVEVSTKTIAGNATGTIRLLCVGRYRGREIQRSLTWDELDDLFYEIAHLNGRLNVISTAQVPSLSSSDRSLLQAFLSNNHPTYPIPTNLPLQPQSSRT